MAGANGFDAKLTHAFNLADQAKAIKKEVNIFGASSANLRVERANEALLKYRATIAAFLNILEYVNSSEFQAPEQYKVELRNQIMPIIEQFMKTGIEMESIVHSAGADGGAKGGAGATPRNNDWANAAAAAAAAAVPAYNPSIFDIARRAGRTRRNMRNYLHSALTTSPIENIRNAYAAFRRSYPDKNAFNAVSDSNINDNSTRRIRNAIKHYRLPITVGQLSRVERFGQNVLSIRNASRDFPQHYRNRLYTLSRGNARKQRRTRKK